MPIIQRILQSDPVAFVVVLGLLIFFHEAGHFFVAKLFRVRVLVFSFGFGKRLFGFQAGGTDYRVSLIPLGGYVRMAGDTPEDNQPSHPDEFLSRPKWQRFLILFAGPFMNLFIAVALIAAVDMWGVPERLIQPIIGEVTKGDPADKAGLRYGDRIVSIGGEPVADYDDLRLNISMHAGKALRIEYVRDGKPLTTVVTPKREETDFGPVGRVGIRPLEEPIVGKVTPGSIAAKAGLQPGDRIVGANGKPIRQYAELEPVIIESKGAPIALDLQRGPSTFHTTLAASTDEKDPFRGFLPPTKLRKLSFGPAIADSLQQNWKILKLAGAALSRLVTGEGSMKELSGPLSIARISGEVFRNGGVIGTLLFMAMISLQLGVMNLLPIPVLDGGHIMVLLIEGAARRDLSIRVKERIQQLGFALLAALMIVVIYNDILGAITRMKRGG